MRVLAPAPVLLALFAMACARQQKKLVDPLEHIYRPAVEPTVSTLLARREREIEYDDSDFPMGDDEFDEFRRDVVDALTKALELDGWSVPADSPKTSPLRERFRCDVLATIEHDGLVMEARMIELTATGERIPAVICLPPGDAVHAGVCCFSGHSANGLRDLVIDLDSYQAGIAARLAHAGFATIAVEKVDSGYLARGFPSGVDEGAVAKHKIGIGETTRSLQLRACIAAVEVLAGHPRVDAARIGATGVSLGGWLSVQTALFDHRIRAVADFGRKTVLAPSGMSPAEYAVRDICHVLPGVAALCQRNLLTLAYAPRPLMAGHGRRDKESHEQFQRHYRRLFGRQYAALDRSDDYTYHVHDGGDTMPADAVIAYFRSRFGSAGECPPQPTSKTRIHSSRNQPHSRTRRSVSRPSTSLSY